MDLELWVYFGCLVKLFSFYSRQKVVSRFLTLAYKLHIRDGAPNLPCINRALMVKEPPFI